VFTKSTIMKQVNLLFSSSFLISQQLFSTLSSHLNVSGDMNNLARTLTGLGAGRPRN